jgi:pimeloyl-ACP methyl ester carboxylesterase
MKPCDTILRFATTGLLTLAIATSTAQLQAKEPNSIYISPPVPANFESHTVDTGSAKIHYLIGGKGPVLLLVHGWPETAYEWRKMMPELSKHYTVIAVDLRGMGESSPEPSGYDKKTLANDLFGLTEKLGYKQISLIGHDWGGPVAYAFAAQHPSSVNKLILIEGSPFGPWMKTIEPLWFFTFLRLPNHYAENLIEGRESDFLKYFYSDKQMHVVPVFDEQVVSVYTSAYARPGRMTATYGLYRSIDQDVTDNVQFSKVKLTMPVMAVGAEMGGGELTFTGAKAVVDNPVTVLFKNTGHFIPEERPTELLGIVEDFLAGKKVPAIWEAAK